MKKTILLFFVFSFIFAQNYTLKSPSEKISTDISFNDSLTFLVRFVGKEIIKSSRIGMTIDGKDVFSRNRIKQTDKKSINEIIKPVVPLKEIEISDNCNELKITFKNGNGIIFRCYNNGVAYRFFTDYKNDIIVDNEYAGINFNSGDSIYFPEEESFHSHNERYYKQELLSNINDKRFCSLPALIYRNDNIKINITETALLDYPGMWLKGSGENKLNSIFPAYPSNLVKEGDRNVKVKGTENFIAKTSGKRYFPWRIFAISESDKEILVNNLPYILAEPDRIKDAGWIKPGKVAWDWFNANNVYGVDFKSGVNTETYKYFIDFASKYGIEYIILDEGWSKTDDLRSIVPDINLPELINYGKDKNVGIILWVTWKTLDEQLDIIPEFEKWGVKGIKVDFMQRDDQPMVNYYTKIAELAARHHLLVDFHGAYKPSGLHRSYPNVMTFEGVRGGEQNKWSDKETPGHNVTLPFIRMFAGPMDYTPGGMLNATKEEFKISFERPMVQGTRCHQLAMYVIYESPLQMLCDSPSNYLRETETMEFLKDVPAIWEKTIALEADAGKYVVMARKKDNKWYIGGMTDWTAREFEISFDFLDEGNYRAEIYTDGINAYRIAFDYKLEKNNIRKGDKLKVKMAPGGGFVIKLKP